MFKWKWYRWRVVIVGRESGRRTPLPFLRWRHYVEARKWCIEQNSKNNGRPGNLTYYEVERIE